MISKKVETEETKILIKFTTFHLHTSKSHVPLYLMFSQQKQKKKKLKKSKVFVLQNLINYEISKLYTHLLPTHKLFNQQSKYNLVEKPGLETLIS